MTFDFTQEVENHRHELRVHCYRMSGSFDDAEDLAQPGDLPGRVAVPGVAVPDRDQRVPGRRGVPTDIAAADVPWLQAFPDAVLDAPADAEVVARETIEPAFLVALQHLPGKQRAVLRDVLGRPATEVAGLLDNTVAAVNTALQRARVTLRKHLPERRAEWSGDSSAREKAAVKRFVDATEQGDLAAVLREDVVWTMPPQPEWRRGRDALVAEWAPVLTGPTATGRWRTVVTSANRHPAVASSVRRPGSEVLVAVDVLRVEGDEVTDVVRFPSDVFARFGLPASL